MLLGERSRDNLYFRLILGLWMYANGASRQQFAISNHLGYTVSYTTIVGRGKKGREQYERSRDGLLSGDDSPTDIRVEPNEVTSDPSHTNTTSEEEVVVPTACAPLILEELEQRNEVPLGLAPTTLPVRLPGRVVAVRRTRHPGTIELLSQSMREEARRAATKGTGEFIYDNLNVYMGPADETLGKTLGNQSLKLEFTLWKHLHRCARFTAERDNS